MACSRGEASPDSHTKLLLFAHSGGFCQKPDCNRELFIDLKSKKLHIAEMAHIIAASDDGPRAKAEMDAKYRGSYDNLILLCPSCHAEIDKAPTVYTDAIVSQWKREHHERLQQIFGVVRYERRDLLRSHIEPLLTINKSIFEQYGPHLEYRLNPESEQARVWKRKMVSNILPNSRRILASLDANRHLMNSHELAVVEEFRQHIDDLTVRHLDGNSVGSGKTFPSQMNSICSGEIQ